MQLDRQRDQIVYTREQYATDELLTKLRDLPIDILSCSTPPCLADELQSEDTRSVISIHFSSDSLKLEGGEVLERDYNMYIQILGFCGELPRIIQPFNEVAKAFQQEGRLQSHHVAPGTPLPTETYLPCPCSI